MKWFKHDANASVDSKLQRIRLKYGMEGYGLYWYLLECIARTVESHNLTFELEEDAELIAAATGIHHERVEEMMRYMISIRLFESSQGRVFCLKMADRTDEYTQKLIRNHNENQQIIHCPDKIPTVSGESPSYKNRTEENRTEENKKRGSRFSPPSIREVEEYCKERGRGVDPQKWYDFYKAKGWMVGKNKMVDWEAAVRTWEKKEGQKSGSPLEDAGYKKL